MLHLETIRRHAHSGPILETENQDYRGDETIEYREENDCIALAMDLAVSDGVAKGDLEKLIRREQAETLDLLREVKSSIEVRSLISYTEAIAEAHRSGLENHPKSYIIGLGVNYPNGADGTTKGLAEAYPQRVLDCPVSESAVTGMCVGMATMGFNTIVHHGRVEFALLAMDQILTQAAMGLYVWWWIPM